MNYLGILIAAVAGMAVGFLWYGPLFGKVWINLSKFTNEQMSEAKMKGMSKTYMLAFLAILVTSWILNIMISEFATSTGSALRLGFLVWLGFLVPTMANSVLWEGKSAKLYAFNIAERLTTLLVMSGIVSYFL